MLTLWAQRFAKHLATLAVLKGETKLKVTHSKTVFEMCDAITSVLVSMSLDGDQLPLFLPWIYFSP